MASAICDVASSSRTRAAPFAPDGWPAWFLSVETRSGRVLWSAGKSPKSRPVANVRPIAEQDDGAAHAECDRVLHFGRQQRDDEHERPVCDDQAGHSAEDRQQQRFGEELSD